MKQNVDICIIGAGAAGLAAACVLQPGLKACLIDKNEIPGRKILATGGGRCNLTNAGCADHELTLGFFRSLGLECYRDGQGRYYPYSNTASDVVKVMTDALEKRGDIIWSMGTEAESVKAAGIPPSAPEGEDLRSWGQRGLPFVVRGRKKTGEMVEIHSLRLLIAAGGKAAPAFGTTGDGYRLARELGHRVSRTRPILTGVSCPLPDELAGVRARGEVRLLHEGKIVAHEKGEIQFTRDGLSGICVFDLTCHIRAREGESPQNAFSRYSLELDLAPDLGDEKLAGRKSSFGILNEKLAALVPIENIHCWRLPVKNVWGWDRAQCTGGGVITEEIDPGTMESRICPGLYFAGEILDIQGSCGGYNLQNAWETGIKAAKAINGSLKGRF